MYNEHKKLNSHMAFVMRTITNTFVKFLSLTFTHFHFDTNTKYTIREEAEYVKNQKSNV